MHNHFGIYQGSVLNNNDPARRGRVICQVPQVLGDSKSGWCEPIYPTITAPSVREIVWLHFVNGDLTRPVYFSSEAITAARIIAGSITADKIAIGAVTQVKIADGAITADKIEAGAVTASKITGDAINGKTITGATFQTSDLINRGVKIDAAGLKAYNLAGTLETVRVNASDGMVTLRGITVTGTTDVGTSAVTPGNEPPVRIGNVASSHIRMDENEIQAMGSNVAGDVATLALNIGGGAVNLGSTGNVTIGTGGSNDITIGASTSVVTIHSMIKSDSRSIAITALGTIFSASVTFATPFPSGAAVPNVVVTPEVADPSLFHVSVESISRSGFTINAVKDSGSTDTYSFQWFAIST